MLTLPIYPADDSLIVIVGGRPAVIPITLAGGQKLARGAVLGHVSKDDTYKLSDATADTDESYPALVLAKDTDASGGPVQTIAYRDAALRVEALTLGEGLGIESVELWLSKSNITLVQTGVAH